MLTKSEKQLMELLWTVGEPLTYVNIIERGVDKSWKDSYIHIMIRSLLKKGVIKVAGVQLVCKNYARKFAPAMTKEEYIAKTLIHDNIWTQESIPDVFRAFVNETENISILDEFISIVNARKMELN